jgi:uncharacterized alkaline shock family protein YloU
MHDTKDRFELSEDAALTVLKKILEKFEHIRLSGKKSIAVEKEDDSFVVKLNLQIKSSLSVVETGEKLQQEIYHEFKNNTGFELKRIDLHFENLFD